MFTCFSLTSGMGSTPAQGLCPGTFGPLSTEAPPYSQETVTVQALTAPIPAFASGTDWMSMPGEVLKKQNAEQGPNILYGNVRLPSPCDTSILSHCSGVMSSILWETH